MVSWSGRPCPSVFLHCCWYVCRMCLRVWNCGVKGYVLWTHIARLAAEPWAASPSSSGPVPCWLTSKGKYASGFIFSFSPRILCFLSQGREGPGVLSGPSGQPPSHPVLSLSPSHLEAGPVAQMCQASLRGWGGVRPAWCEEEGARQLAEPARAGERV